MGRILRRQFLLAAGAILATPGLSAQPARRRLFRIALLPDNPPEWSFTKWIVERLGELGRVEGRDYELYHSGVYYGPDTTAAVDRVMEAKPDLIFVLNLGYVIEAHKRTKVIPIVMWISGFPVEGGVAESLAKPGKNVTGLTIYAGGEVFGKLLELVCGSKAGIKRVGFFMSYVPPFHPRVEADVIIRGISGAAVALGVDLRVFEIAAPEQVDGALAQVASQGVEGLVLTSDAPLTPRRQDIIRFAVAKGLPTISDSYWGGGDIQPLLSYAPSYRDLIRGGIDYVDEILWKGAMPGKLPIRLPAKFELVVNAKMAATMGISLPKELMLRADRVIE